MERPSDLDPLSEVQWEEEGDRALYVTMVDEARSFLNSFQWFGGIRQMSAGLAVPGVVAVFFVDILPGNADAEVDQSVWVVVGDLPPAFIVPDEPVDSIEVLRRYIGEMRRWVQAAGAGEPVDNLIPVNVRPTVESAEMLALRLDFLEREVIGPESR